MLKVYGGAVRAGTADPPSSPPRRAAGGALVDVTLRLIGPSQSIYLDESDESVAVAGALSPDLDLTITTNSSRVLHVLPARTREVIVLGGVFDFERSATFGSAPIGMVRNLRFDLLVVGDCVVDIKRGLAAANLQMAELKSAAAERSNAIALLRTGTAFGAAPFAIAPIHKIKHIVSTHAPDERMLGPLSDRGIGIETVYEGN
ncbi:hypothetical protein [Rhizobium sp. R635]|uniref:hypothetical protein n=1 Tax=Rhizobium sp. R635 TaxID=1764275 RepID=UPI0032AEF664